MYTDLPQFTRCCFCAPLRLGLLVWGYIKLTLSIFIWLCIADGITNIIYRGYPMPVGLILFMIAEAIDEVFTVILVVAAHKKHVRLFKVYYIYNIVYLVSLGIFFGIHLGCLFASTMAYPHPYLVKIFIMSFVATISLLMVQGYITLLVRSELFKLQDRTNIQFTNHAGEAQCNAYVEKV